MKHVLLKLKLFLMAVAFIVPLCGSAEIINDGEYNINYQCEGDSCKIIESPDVTILYTLGGIINLKGQNRIVTEIGDRAFYQSPLDFYEMRLSSSIQRIGDEAFSGVKIKRNFWLGGGLHEIGSRAFASIECDKIVINSYDPPVLGPDCFIGAKINSINVPESRVEAYRSAPGWKEMADIIVGDDIPFLLWNDIAFKINSDDNSVTINNCMSSWRLMKFRGVEIFPEEFIWQGKKYDDVRINSYAFGDVFRSPECLKLPDYITRLEDNAFSNSYVSAFELSQNLKYIGSHAFVPDNGKHIDYIICNAPIPPVLADDAFDKCVVDYVLTDYPEAYSTAPVWSDLMIVESLESLTGPLPEGIGYEINRDYPDQITILDAGATGNITIPMFTKIGDKQYKVTGMNMFTDNKNLTSLTLPSTIKTIPYGREVSIFPSKYSGAFTGCEALHTFKAPGVTTVGDYAFIECKSLTNVELSSAYCRLYDLAFQGCSNLSNSGFKGRVIEAITFPFLGTPMVFTEDMMLNLRKIKNGLGCPVPENIRLKDCTICGHTYLETVTGSAKSVRIEDCSLDYGSYHEWPSLELNSSINPDYVIINNLDMFSLSEFFDPSQASSLAAPLVVRDNLYYESKIYMYDIKLDYYKLKAYYLEAIQNGVQEYTLRTLQPFLYALGSDLTDLNGTNRGHTDHERGSKICDNGFIYDETGKTLVFAPVSGDFEIPYGVERIGQNAFSRDPNLTSIKIPETIKEIGASAFSDCNKLKTVIFPKTPFKMGNNVFGRTFFHGEEPALQELYLPEGLTFNGDPGGRGIITNAPSDRGLSDLQSIIFDRRYDLTKIVEWDVLDACKKFAVRTKISSIRNDNKTRSINDVYDPSENNILGIQYPENAIIDSLYVYSGDHSKLFFAHACHDLRIDKKVNELGVGALQACGKIGSFALKESATSLQFPEGALLGTEPETFESNRDWTYAGSDAMLPSVKRVVLGKNVRSVPAQAFSGSTGLRELISLSHQAPHLAPTSFSDEQYENLKPQIPTDSIDSYLVLANGWRRFKSLADMLPPVEGTHTFGDYEARMTDTGWEIVKYTGTGVATLTVPETFDEAKSRSGAMAVTSIADKAFAGNKTLTSIRLPEGIKSIGRMAFAGCDQLETVSLSTESLRYIGSAAFQNCSALADIDLNKVEIIGAGAFENCKSLKSVVLGSEVSLIGESVFEGCTSISSVDMSLCDSIQIAAGAFRGCSALRSIEIGRGIRSIGFEAFSGSGITELTFAEGSQLESIGARAFYQYRGRGALTLPNSVKEIGESAFEYARLLTDITLPNNPELNIGDKAFYSCERVANIIWPEKFGKIGSRAFEKTAITSLDINVDSIGSNAFAATVALATVRLGDSLKYIGGKAFFNSGVTSVVLPTTDGPEPVIEIFSNTFTNDDNDHVLTHLELGNKVKTVALNSFICRGYFDPGTSVEAIAADNVMETDTTVVLPASLTLLQSEISAPKIDLAYSATPLRAEKSISANEIYIDRLVMVNFKYNYPRNLYSSVGNGLKVVFSDNRSHEFEISQELFDAGGKYLAIHVGASVKSITDLSVNHISFSEGIETLSAGALSTTQKSLRLPGSLTSIAEGAITCQYNELEELIIGDSPEASTLAMEQNAISGLENLKSVYIGRDIKTVGLTQPFTFANATNLTKACFGEGTTRVPENMFRNCTSLTNVIIPDNITEVGARAYMNCSALNVLSISAKIKSIGDAAYQGCTGLERIVARGVTPAHGNAGFGAYVEDNVMLYVPEEAFDDYLASDLFYPFINVATHNEKIVESVTTDANLREVAPGQVVDIMGQYGLGVNLVGTGASNRASRKAKGRAAASDVDLSNAFYWFSTNPDAASVTQDGVVTVHTDGAAEIWAVVLDGSDQKARIGINNIVLGDSNDDGFVTVTDAVNTANYAVGNEVGKFFFRSADVNRDENITLSDASATISILMGQYYSRNSAPRLSAASTTLADHLFISDYKVSAGEETDIDVMLVSENDYVALQADVTVPVGMSLETINAGPRAEGHTLFTQRINSRTMRVVLFDLGNSTFIADSEPLFSLKVKVNESECDEIAMNNVLASDAYGKATGI